MIHKALEERALRLHSRIFLFAHSTAIHKALEERALRLVRAFGIGRGLPDL